MRLLSFLLLLVASVVAFATIQDDDLSDQGDVDAGGLPECTRDHFLEDRSIDSAEGPELDCADLDAPAVASETNSTSLDLPMPKYLKIGYGYQWKKGLQRWVALPMLGLLACRQYQDLGRMAVGPKHGACQKSFEIQGKWYQLSGCNPTTGMPKYLLDAKGYTIASCARKQFNILCLKQGKIFGRGSCEGSAPDTAPPRLGTQAEQEG